MLKQRIFLGFLLLLAIVLIGCNDPPKDAKYYNLKDGKQVPCSINNNTSDPPCSTPFYAVTGGKTYYCTEEDENSCTETTPTPDCKPDFAYENIVNKGQTWKVIPPQQQDENNSSVPAQVTFTSKVSETVEVTDSAGVSSTTTGELAENTGLVKAKITESVQVSLNVSVSVSVKAETDNEYMFTIPAGETAYANYGVRIQVTEGHLYDKAQCEGPGSQSDWKIVTAYVPMAVGWCVRTNKQPPCPSM